MAPQSPGNARFLAAAVLMVLHLASPGQELGGGDEWDMNPTGVPIGGGIPFVVPIESQLECASTVDQFLRILSRAGRGDVLWVCDSSEIDLSGRKGIVIPGGVTLASGRGGGGSRGGMLFTNSLDGNPLLTTGGSGVRITGIRLRGPDSERHTEELRSLPKEERYQSRRPTTGVRIEHPDCVVENTELLGWGYAAVFVSIGGERTRVHHSHIHHNQLYGLGYGVVVDRSDAIVEANLFDWNRHAIAGTGRPGTNYEACYNVVGPNANGHAFDMHGGADRRDGTDIAGDSILIHHNTFQCMEYPAIVIRGIPQNSAEIHHNQFAHATEAQAVQQTNAVGNLTIGPNRFSVPAAKR